MLKQTVTYEDFNGNQAAETLYFNLTRTEIMNMLDILPRLENFQKRTEGETRDLTSDEVKDMLDIVKLLVEKAYGVRGDDGKRFMKSPSLFDEFTQTAVYDEFVFSLFKNPEKCVEFMTGILPREVLENLPDSPNASAQIVQLPPPQEEIAVPAYVKENRNPTEDEIRRMNPDELRDAFQFRMRNDKQAQPDGSDNA